MKKRTLIFNSFLTILISMSAQNIGNVGNDFVIKEIEKTVRELKPDTIDLSSPLDYYRSRA